MTKEEIIKLIELRISEHNDASNDTNTQLSELKKEKTIESISKHMVLKDKLLFHRACSLVLTDLLKDI